MKRFIYGLLIITLYAVSCDPSQKEADNEADKILCDKNDYSRNGVESVSEYIYETKEGEIDYTTKTLYKYEKFDSLGNIIYHKGNYYPNINDIPISDFHYAILQYYSMPYNSQLVYKMDYDVYLLRRISVFDEGGNYIAKVDHSNEGISTIDSVYSHTVTSNTLLYVYKRYNNKDGLDSLSLKYGLKKRQLAIEEENINQYKWLNDSTLQTKWKSTNFLFPGGPLTTTSTYTDTYDTLGNIVRHVSERGYKASIKYDKWHHNIEDHAKYKSEITASKHVYDTRGLLTEYYSYEDDICIEYRTYEYTYYTYSPSYSTIPE